ncbi:MAG: catalase [Paraglaciecola sp.]|jgi:catalase
MKRTIISALLASSIAAVSATLAAAEIQATDMVDIFEKLGGKHAGYRKAHARGLCATGTFTPASSEQFAGSKLLAGGDLPVMLRFSVGGADPGSDERVPGTRGAGVRIQLPDGGYHIFTGNNFPVFAGKDVETFHGFLSTLLPDENGKRDPMKTAAFIKANPSVQANVAWQQQAQTPASYANTEFFGIHTFYFNKDAGHQTKFRWHLVPDLGVKTIPKEEAAKMDNGFLVPAMATQLKDGPVSFTLWATIGEPQDSDNDPSSQWPDDRTDVTLGKITLSSAGENECNNVNFDPNMLSAGFTPSDDPILKIRTLAYAISFGKRLSNQ